MTGNNERESAIREEREERKRREREQYEKIAGLKEIYVGKYRDYKREAV